MIYINSELHVRLYYDYPSYHSMYGLKFKDYDELNKVTKLLQSDDLVTKTIGLEFLFEKLKLSKHHHNVGERTIRILKEILNDELFIINNIEFENFKHTNHYVLTLNIVKK